MFWTAQPRSPLMYDGRASVPRIEPSQVCHAFSFLLVPRADPARDSVSFFETFAKLYYFNSAYQRAKTTDGQVFVTVKIYFRFLYSIYGVTQFLRTRSVAVQPSIK